VLSAINADISCKLVPLGAAKRQPFFNLCNHIARKSFDIVEGLWKQALIEIAREDTTRYNRYVAKSRDPSILSKDCENTL